ncbi:MAG: DUF1365 domain-containing protein, partial [Mangrovicoccus sp.]
MSPQTQMDHIQGRSFHGRHGAIENRFTYGVDYVLWDPETAQPPSLLSRNRRNLMALYDCDYGGPMGEGRGTDWVRDTLAAHGQLEACGRILLLAQPRVLGHVFNPVSFWLCHGLDGSLRAVIAEVSNTFGDRHCYLCHHTDQSPIRRDDTLLASKVFHVSPFQPVQGSYQFRFDIAADRIGIWINYRDSDGGGVYATLTGKRRKLSNLSILSSCLRRPFGSRRVLALIQQLELDQVEHR